MGIPKRPKAIPFGREQGQGIGDHLTLRRKGGGGGPGGAPLGPRMSLLPSFIDVPEQPFPPRFFTVRLSVGISLGEAQINLVRQLLTPIDIEWLSTSFGNLGEQIGMLIEMLLD